MERLAYSSLLARSSQEITDLPRLFSLLIETLHLNADSRLIHTLVLKVDALQPHSLLVASLVSLGYAGFVLIEGGGLWQGFSWAAYLAVVSTSLLIEDDSQADEALNASIYAGVSVDRVCHNT